MKYKYNLRLGRGWLLAPKTLRSHGGLPLGLEVPLGSLALHPQGHPLSMRPPMVWLPQVGGRRHQLQPLHLLKWAQWDINQVDYVIQAKNPLPVFQITSILAK